MRNLTLLLVAALTLTACPHTGPGPSIPSAIIKCAKDEIQNKGVTLIPKVNDALQRDDWSDRLLALIDASAGVTADVLACVVRSVLGDYLAASQANPSDAISKRSADRAQTFIDAQKYTFAP
jgi:hypothetical protein